MKAGIFQVQTLFLNLRQSIQIEMMVADYAFFYFLNNSSKAVVPTTVPSGIADKSIW